MRILKIEIQKIFFKRRSYIGFVAVLAMVLLVFLAMFYEGQDLLGFLTQNLENTFVFHGNLINGNLFAYIVLKSLWVHFPILVVLVTGDLISGEEQAGTFRMVLIRPVSRFTLISAKFIAGLLYVSLLVLFMAVVSIVLGRVAFGNGDLLVLMQTVNIFPADDAMWRLVLAFIFGIASMGTVAALSFFLSAVTGNSLTAILGTLAIVIVLTFVSAFSIPVLEIVKPFLFTTYMTSWQSFFYFEMDNAQIVFDLFVLLAHIVGFYLLTVLYFNRKDILS